jgi:hypothetical protein
MEDNAVSMVAFIIGFVVGVLVLAKTGYSEHWFNQGLATAVACAPGTYLEDSEDSEDGLVYCIGGKGETWRVRP